MTELYNILAVKDEKGKKINQLCFDENSNIFEDELKKAEKYLKVLKSNNKGVKYLIIKSKDIVYSYAILLKSYEGNSVNRLCWNGSVEKGIIEDRNEDVIRKRLRKMRKEHPDCDYDIVRKIVN